MSEVKNMELSRVFSTCLGERTWHCHGYVLLFRGKEHEIVTGIFDLSEAKNPELS